jgi:hypothetical protein
MKYLNNLVKVFLTILILSSCSKDYSYESEFAEGSIIKDTGGNCDNIKVHGNYVVNIGVDTSNYLELQLDIVKAGAYIVRSDTVNGYYFRSANLVINTGLTVVKLKAEGKPLVVGANKFKIKFDQSECEISVTVLNAPPPPPNIFTIDCSNIIVAGNYFATVPLSNINKVTLQVSALRAGSYNFTTNIVNGVSFTASGIFPNAGTYMVDLLASTINNPTAATTTGAPAVYTIAGGITPCTFSIDYADAPVAFTVNCSTIVVSGTFTATIPLNSTNKIMVSVNSASAGSYNITTNKVNGIIFGASGSFASAGIYTIELFALPSNNIPLTTTTSNYTINGSTGSACSFDVNYGAAPLYATYFVDCAGISVSGNYNVGVLLNVSNTITLTINVATVGGIYNITTTSANGVKYGASGTFPSAGIHTVILRALPFFDFPEFAGNYGYTIIGGTSGTPCTLGITYN